jgi:hypothetical protein
MNVVAAFVHIAAIAGRDIKIALFRHFQQRAVHAGIELIVKL